MSNILFCIPLIIEEELQAKNDKLADVVVEMIENLEQGEEKNQKEENAIFESEITEEEEIILAEETEIEKLNQEIVTRIFSFFLLSLFTAPGI